MMTRDWAADAKTFLLERYGRVCSDEYPLKIEPPLDASEAEFFLRDKEDGLFLVDDESYVQTEFLRRPSGENQKQKMIQLFWRRGNRKYLFREGVCQLSTVSSLIRNYGWSASEIVMEPGKREFGKLAYAVDIVSQDRTICCEVKRNDMEFGRLVEGFAYCCDRGSHVKDECKYKRNHAKYEFCSCIRPLYFLAVSPGKAISFKLTYDGKIGVERSEGLVHREACRRNHDADSLRRL